MSASDLSFNLMDIDQIDLVKTSWDNLKNKDELGLKLMIKMFQADNDIKYLWIFASNLESEEKMRNNSEIIYHAKKMITSIDKLILFLKSNYQTLNLSCFPDQIDLIRMGKRHFHYGLKKEYFQCFEICLIESLKESLEEFDLKTTEAWISFNKFMFDQLEIGMNKVENEIEERDKLVAELKIKKINHV